MDNSKEIFYRMVDKIESLRISKKDKQILLDDLTELLLQYSSEVENKTYKKVNERIEKRLSNIEEFLRPDLEHVDCDVEIKCPYCNKVVQIYMNKAKMDAKCPMCKKAIELEWSFEKKK